MKVRYKFRFYPTPEQEKSLSRVFGSCRFVYNWALRLRTDSFHQTGKGIDFRESSAALTKLKQQPETQWLNEVSSVPTQQALRHLQTAFNNFFAKRTKYPKFKRKTHSQKADYTRSAFNWNANTQILKVAGLGRLKVTWSRAFKSKPTTVTISKNQAGQYFVTLVLDEDIQTLPKTGFVVGVDLGINRLATLSNSEQIHNPQHTHKYAKKLAKAQRFLSRREKGSGRWKTQRLKVARIHQRISNSRNDHLNKVTTNLVKRFDVICMENLNVRGMAKNRYLAKSISDAGFGAFVMKTKYKCAWYGKSFRAIDRWYPSSKRCSSCGVIAVKMPLSVRSWVCTGCGTMHDRDENAAKNIEQVGVAEGHSVKARGELGKSNRVCVHDRSVRGNVNLKGAKVLLESHGL